MALRVRRPDSVRPDITDACQSCKMATLSNKLLYFMFRLILRFRSIKRHPHSKPTVYVVFASKSYGGVSTRVYIYVDSIILWE